MSEGDRWTWVEWGTWPRELRIGVHWSLVDARWECVGLTIEPAPGTRVRPLLATDLRGIQMGALLQLAGRPSADEKPVRPVASSRTQGDRLEEAAAVYLDAYGRGEAPTKAVATHFGVKHNTAAKWIVECRKRGLIGRTEQGRAGGGPFDPRYARQVLRDAGHSRQDIERIMGHFPRVIEAELVEALEAAAARLKPKEDK